MTIPFSQISATNRVPSSQTEVRGAGPAGVRTKRVVLVANRLSTGGVAADTPFQIFAKTDGFYGGGVGSPLGEMAYYFKSLNADVELWGIGLADDGSGVAAAGSIGATGTATEAKTAIARIGGREYKVDVANTGGAAGLLTSLKALIDADTRRPATTSTIASNAIPLTSRWKGSNANAIDIRWVQVPAGITGTTVAMASGATDPAVTNAIAALGTEKWDRIVLATNDATTVAAFETEMTRRWGPLSTPLDGLVVTSIYGTLSTATTWASSRNSKHVFNLPAGPAPTPPWVWAAQCCAREVAIFQSDPGTPRINVVLDDCIVPDLSARFDEDDRQALLEAGLSTYKVIDGKAVIERLVTTYLTDEYSQSDETFRDVVTMDKIAQYREDWTRVTNVLQEYKLVDDDTPTAPGTKAITRSGGKAMMDSFYEAQCRTGNWEKLEYFTAYSRCERDPNDANRLNFYHPANVGNFVVTIATVLQVGL